MDLIKKHNENKMMFSIDNSKSKLTYYVFFKNDLKDRLIYIDDFGSLFYKKNKKIIYLNHKQESEFRDIRKKYS